MKKSNQEIIKSVKTLRVVLIFIAILISFSLISYFIWLSFDSLSQRGQFGDMFGSLNALFSALAFAGIIWTIYLQKTDLILHQNEIIEQNNLLQKQHFESTFFKMIELYHIVVNSLTYGVHPSGGPKYQGKNYFEHYSGKINGITKGDAFWNNLEHYFKHIYGIIKFIENRPKSIEPDLYINILKSQISNSENTVLKVYLHLQDQSDELFILAKKYKLLS